MSLNWLIGAHALALRCETRQEKGTATGSFGRSSTSRWWICRGEAWNWLIEVNDRPRAHASRPATVHFFTARPGTRTSPNGLGKSCRIGSRQRWRFCSRGEAAVKGLQTLFGSLGMPRRLPAFPAPCQLSH